MLRMSAPGKLAESAEAFVSEYVDETYSRSVKALHGHLLDQAIEFVARMSLASVVFRKTHVFEIGRAELQSRLHLVCRLLLEKKKKPRRYSILSDHAKAL